MPAYLRTELHDDLACNGASLLAILGGGYWDFPRATFSVTGEESLTIAGDAAWPDLAELILGRILRVCTTDPAVFDEWRIRDVDLSHEGDAQRVTITCDPIRADLARAPYEEIDAAGVPYQQYIAAGITTEEVVDNAVLPALAAAGLTHISKGTIDATNTFDIDVQDANAQSLTTAIIDPARAPAEIDVRRNGTTDYKLDLVAAIGADAPTLWLRTRRNLMRTLRRYRGGEAVTAIRPRGKQDGAHPGIAFAIWRVAATDTGTDRLTVEDPRGGSYPGLIGFDGQLTGMRVARLVATYADDAILDCFALTQEIEVADASLYTVGDLIEFKLTTGETGDRLSTLTNPAAVALYGTYARPLDRPLLSGAVNYAPNPFVRDFTGEIRIDNAGGGGTITTTAASPVIAGIGGNALQGWSIGDRVHRTSDDALVGTVLSVDSISQVTLTADAAVVAVGFDFYLLKNAPAGASAAGAGNQRYTLTSQVDSSVEGVTSKAWRIIRSNSVDPMNLRITPFPDVPSSPDIPVTVWCWVEVVSMNSGGIDLEVKLLRADTFAQLGSTVAITDASIGQLVRVEFSAVDLSAATAGVVIEFSQAANASEYLIGPWGVQPAAWSIVDTENYGANDLWHAGNAALADAWPAEWEVTALDLEQMDGERFDSDQLVKGQTVKLYDQDLGITSTLRLLEFTRDYGPATREVSLRLGRIQPTLSDLLAPRAPKESLPIGAIARTIAAGIRDLPIESLPQVPGVDIDTQQQNQQSLADLINTAFEGIP